MRSALALLALIAMVSAVSAFGLGENRFGRLGAMSKGGGGVTPPAGNFRITDTGAFRITDTSDSRIISP